MNKLEKSSYFWNSQNYHSKSPEVGIILATGSDLDWDTFHEIAHPYFIVSQPDPNKRFQVQYPIIVCILAGQSMRRRLI